MDDGLSRREFSGRGAALLAAGCMGGEIAAQAPEPLYGLIGEIRAPGKRQELIGYLLEGSGEMPGNLAYIVAEDAAAADTVCVTEVWRSKADHEASLTLPRVRAGIASARPIIAGFGQSVETRPVGIPQ